MALGLALNDRHQKQGIGVHRADQRKIGIPFPLSPVLYGAHSP